MQMLASSFRFSFLSGIVLLWKLIFVSCPLNELVDVWSLVFEYTWVSRTMTLISILVASIRDSDWNPISFMAPSPPTIHRRFFCQPLVSHLARTPIATAGAFSKRELVHAIW